MLNVELEKGKQNDGPDPHHEHAKKSYGVQKVEILNKQYSSLANKAMIFVSIFLMAYVYRLDAMVRKTFTAHAINSYRTHSLISTVGVVRSVSAAASMPIYSRLSDAVGRIELIVCAVVLYVIGTIVCSQATDVTRYAAGMILYQFGLSGLAILFKIISADFSSLNWRLFCTLVSASPYIINTWISGNVASTIGVKHWSWGIGMWAIWLPIATLPLVCCFLHMTYRAKRNGDWKELKALEGRSFKALLKFIWEDLDIIGVLSFTLILGLILTPFTLAGGEHRKWKTARVIVPLVLGFVMIPVFIVWERKFAAKPICPEKLFKKKSVIVGLCIGVLIDFVWQIQGEYLYTILVVAVNESVRSATRINSLYSFSTTISGLIVGLIVVYVRRLKFFIIGGTCIWMIALGIMVKYRGGLSSHGGVIAGQVLLGVGSGLFTHSTQALLQALVSHEVMSTVTMLYSASYYVGSAIGSSISGAVWTQALPHQINKRIANATIAKMAYKAPLSFIVKNKWGTPGREALVEAYRHVQKILIVISLCFCVPIVCLAVLLDDPVLENVQAKEDTESEYESDTATTATTATTTTTTAGVSKL